MSDVAPKEKPAPKKSAADWASKKDVPMWAVMATAHRVGWEMDPQAGPTLLLENDFDSAVSGTLSARLG